MEYKVLTLWQPWASLLVHGVKKIETRPKPTNWTSKKGAYSIHSASKWSKEQANICLQEPFKSILSDLGLLFWLDKVPALGYTFLFPLGQIIGSIEVTECCMINSKSYWKQVKLSEKESVFAEAKFSQIKVNEPELSFGNYESGRYAWLTQNPRILKTPIPYKGGQGYYVPFNGDTNQLIFI